MRAGVKTSVTAVCFEATCFRILPRVCFLALQEYPQQTITRTRHSLSQTVASFGLYFVPQSNASKQPGNLRELVLHETVVSWLRVRLVESIPQRACLQTREAFSTRLKMCCESVNRDLDVEGLCKSFPKRIAKLRERQGDRLTQWAKTPAKQRQMYKRSHEELESNM